MIYLDNAATSYPKPESVYRAVYDCMINSGGNPGRSGHVLSVRAADIVYKTRCIIAEMLNAQPERVIFTKNATEAISLAIKSFAAENSTILISSIEHNSVYRSVYALGDKGVRVKIFDACDSASETLRSFSENLTNDVSLVVALHRSNIAPIELPILQMGRLCREKGIHFVIDASQSLGNSVIDIEKTGASAVCAPGHKALYGIQGCGFAVFSSRVNDEEIIPLYEGGSGSMSLSPKMPDSLPERAEAGTLSVPAIAGLLKGAEFVRERGENELFEYESELISGLCDRLCMLKGIRLLCKNGSKGNVLSFCSSRLESEYICSLLDKSGICARGGLHCAPLAHSYFKSIEKGAVRISVGAFNKMSDIEVCARRIREIVRSG